MAIINAQTANGFSGLPAVRQIGLMIGLAASVALGVAVVLWSQSPSYTLLYGNLDSKDSAQVADALQKANIPFKLDDGTGAIMVISGKVSEARMKLSAEGLPKGQGIGFELLDKEQQMGTSQYIQHARFRHAQEIELARSISTMRNVKSARVHLAVPKRTAFIRKQAESSASVVLELYSGRSLNEQQVASIVHMVSSSISSLDPDKVTVVDQNGNLFTNGQKDKAMALAGTQFEHTRKLEKTFKSRIEELISPIVGPGRVRAQVVAEIDFTRTEKTLEEFSPDSKAVRSEQINEQNSGSGNGAEGVPGALSNQPPDEATQTTGSADARQAGTFGSANASRSSRQSTKNYELNKTISHIVGPGTSLTRLSVAVLVDDLQVIDEEGEITRKPLDQQALDRITILVKDAVGYIEARGDTVNVVNASFYTPAAPEALPELAVWEQPWVWDAGKQAVGALFILIMLFGVIKPVLRNLAEGGKNAQQAMVPAAADANGMAAAGMPMAAGQAALADNSAQMPGLPSPSGTDNQLDSAKNLVQEDPARVAQVVKTWVNSDGG